MRDPGPRATLLRSTVGSCCWRGAGLVQVHAARILPSERGYCFQDHEGYRTELRTGAESWRGLATSCTRQLRRIDRHPRTMRDETAPGHVWCFSSQVELYARLQIRWAASQMALQYLANCSFLLPDNLFIARVRICRRRGSRRSGRNVSRTRGIVAGVFLPEFRSLDFRLQLENSFDCGMRAVATFRTIVQDLSTCCGREKP